MVALPSSIVLTKRLCFITSEIPILLDQDQPDQAAGLMAHRISTGRIAWEYQGSKKGTCNSTRHHTDKLTEHPGN